MTDFEFPSKTEWDKMENQSSIKLKSIEIWHKGSDNSSPGYLTGIQIHLTNGQSSPQFLTSYNVNKTHGGKLEIDSDVRKYDFASRANPINGIRLYKENGDLLKSWEENIDSNHKKW